MKKILKFLITIIVFNFLFIFCVKVFVSFKVIIPSLKEANISVFDILHKDINPDKYSKFEIIMSDKSSTLGKNSANKFLRFIERLTYVDYSDMPNIDYPYPSIDEVMDMIDHDAQKGIDKGLQYGQEIN